MGRFRKQRQPKSVPRVETRREQPKRAAKAVAMDRIVSTRKMFTSRGTDPNAFFPFPEIAKLHKAREARRIRKKQKQQQTMQDGNLQGSDQLIDDLNGSFGRGERPHTNGRITSLPTGETAEMACLKLSIVKLTARVELLESKLAALDPHVITTTVLEHVKRYFQPVKGGMQSVEVFSGLENKNRNPLSTSNENSFISTVPIAPSALACVTDPSSFGNTATSSHASVTGDARLAQAAISPRQSAGPETAKMVVDSNNFSSPLLSIASPEYQSVIEEGNVESPLVDAPHQKMSESMLVHNEENSAVASQSKNFLTSLFGTAHNAVKKMVKREIRGDESEGDEERRDDLLHDDNDQGISRAIEERWLADVNVAASRQITVKTEKLLPILKDAVPGDK